MSSKASFRPVVAIRRNGLEDYVAHGVPIPTLCRKIQEFDIRALTSRFSRAGTPAAARSESVHGPNAIPVGSGEFRYLLRDFTHPTSIALQFEPDVLEAPFTDCRARHPVVQATDVAPHPAGAVFLVAGELKQSFASMPQGCSSAS